MARAESIADELESNGRFLNTILDSIGDPIFVKDREHRYIYVNEAKCRLTGHERDAIIGKTDYDFTPPEKEQVDVFVRQDDIVLETGQEDINEEALTGGDGILRTVLTKKSRYIDDAGRRCVVGIIRDITEHKRAEDALKRSQATYLAEAQRLSDTGSFGWNALSGEIFWSDETFRIFGYEPGMKPSIEAMIQRVHPKDVALVKEVIERAAKDQQDFDFEHRLMMPDGSVKYLHVVAHAVRDEPGKLQFMGALMDITARKKTDEALRDSEQRYRHLFHYMPIAILQLSARGLTELFNGLRAAGVAELSTYLDQHPEFLLRAMDALIVEGVNEQAIKTFGAQNQEQLLGPVTRYWQRRPDTFRRSLESRFHRLPTFQEETKMLTLDGREIDVLYTSARLEPMGDLEMSLGSVVDITERVRAQEKLQEVQLEFARAARISVLGGLAASIAHEVNQPLMAIVTNAETCLGWLANDKPDLDEARQAAKRVVNNGHRAGEIIGGIRALAKKSGPAVTQFNINDAIQEVLVLMGGELRGHDVLLETDYLAGLEPVIGDRVQLQQVILNLVMNAIEAMSASVREPRLLRVSSQMDGPGDVLIAVADTGIGIDPKKMDRMFDAFFTTKPEGMGMGLSICRSIVEAHGGRLWASSNPPRGSIFQFTVPDGRGLEQ